MIESHDNAPSVTYLGPVARSLVSVNRWFRGIKTYRFPWYSTLISANHASRNRGLDDVELETYLELTTAIVALPAIPRCSS